MIDFDLWREQFDLYLKTMYYNLKCLCFKNNFMRHINWKDEYNYFLFCKMIYDTTSKKNIIFNK